MIARLVYSAEGAEQAGLWTEGGGMNRGDSREQLRDGSGEHNVLQVGRGGGTREQQEVSGSTPNCSHHV